MPLVAESPEDMRLASLMTFGDDRAHERAQAARRQQIEGADMFAAPPGKGTVRLPVPSRLSASRLAVSSGVLKRSGTGSSSAAGQRTGGSKAAGGGGSKQKAALSKARRLLSLGVKLGLSEPT